MCVCWHSGFDEGDEGRLLKCGWVLARIICTRGSPMLELGNTQKWISIVNGCYDPIQVV